MYIPDDPSPRRPTLTLASHSYFHTDVSGKFEISRQIRGGYIISEALLRKCAQLVETFSGEAPKISITFRDGRTVNSTNPDEVFNDSFIQSTRISETKISGGNFFSQHASITFRKNYDSPIYFIAEGDRSPTLTFERDFINELASSKQWYSPFVLSVTTFSLLTTIFAAPSIFSFIFVSVSMHNHTLDLIAIIVSLTQTLMLLILICSRIEFPSIIFNIGHGARRQTLRVAIWSFIVFTLLSGITIIFLHDWLNDWLKKLF